MTASSTPHDPDRSGELIMRYMEDDLSASDSVLLQTMLRTDPKVREKFVDANLQACLTARLLQRVQNGSAEDSPRNSDPRSETLWGEAVPLQPPIVPENVLPAPGERGRAEVRKPHSALGWSGAIAATLLLSILLIWLLRRDSVEPELASAPLPPSQPVAAIEQTLDAEWANPSSAPTGVLGAGSGLSLRKGVARVRFNGGASVVLEGPAELVIDSPDACTLRSGKLTAQKNGGGFVVQTAAVRVTDLGTEFALDVSADGTFFMQVLSGSVRADRIGQPGSGKVITAGNAIQTRDDPDRALVPAAPRPMAFVTEARFASLAATAESARERWRLFERDLLRDPGLRLYYSFDLPTDAPESVSTLTSDPANARRLRPVGEGQKLVPGRFSTDRAAEFVAAASQGMLVTPAPLKAGPLTVAAWVFADTRAPLGSIAKNWGAVEHGQFHFGLRRDTGTLEIQIRQPDNTDVLLDEGGVPFPTGRWVHVAFVADGQSVRLYRDGREVAAGPCGVPTPNPRVNWIAIGYKAGDDGRTPSHRDGSPGFWDGRIDDIMFLDRALSASEIADLASRSRANP